jgi:hypothetical protein
MKTIFTPKQRREIYKKVKETIRIGNSRGIHLCPNINYQLLSRISHEEYDIYGRTKPFEEYLFEYFPELLMVKPENVKISNTWWKLEDIQIRLKKLDEMIELTRIEEALKL